MLTLSKVGVQDSSFGDLRVIFNVFSSTLGKSLTILHHPDLPFSITKWSRKNYHRFCTKRGEKDWYLADQCFRLNSGQYVVSAANQHANSCSWVDEQSCGPSSREVQMHQSISMHQESADTSAMVEINSSIFNKFIVIIISLHIEELEICKRIEGQKLVSDDPHGLHASGDHVASQRNVETTVSLHHPTEIF